MPPPSAALLPVIVESLTVSFPAVPVTGLGPTFWIPPESPPPLGLVLMLLDTSERVTVSVPPSFEMPPPEPDSAVPFVIASSLSVSVASLRMSPPKKPLPSLAWPNAIDRPEMVTVGTVLLRGFGSTKKTRFAGEDS